MWLFGSWSKGQLPLAVPNGRLSRWNVTPVSVAVLPASICCPVHVGNAAHPIPVLRDSWWMTLRSPAVEETSVTFKPPHPHKTCWFSHLWDCGTLFLLIISLRETSVKKSSSRATALSFCTFCGIIEILPTWCLEEYVKEGCSRLIYKTVSS